MSPTIYYSWHKFKENEGDGTCCEYGEKRNPYRDVVRKPEGKKPLGTPRVRWTADITMDFVGIGYEGETWLHLTQERDNWRALVNMVINLIVP